MKCLVLSFLLLLAATPSWATYVLKQHKVAVSTDNNTATTTGVSFAGSTLEVVVCVQDVGGSDPVITDSNGNTWNHIRSDQGDGSGGFLYVSWWYVINPTGSLSSQTFECNITGLFPAIFVTGWSGNVTSSLVDQQCGLGATNGWGGSPGNVSTWNACTSSITPGSNNELVLGFSGQSNNSVTNITVGSSFSVSDYAGSGTNNFGGVMVYLIQTTATAENPTFTYASALDSPTSGLVSFNAMASSGNRPLGIF